MAFRLKTLEPTEAQVKTAVTDALAIEVALGRVAWYGRFNSGRLWVPVKRQAKEWYWAITYWINGEKKRKGFPDIAGQLSDGRFLAFEVKKPSVKKESLEQDEFMTTVLDGGGVGGIVRSADEAIEIVRRAFE